MKQHLLLLGLMLSALFNVFFVGGYLQARARTAREVPDVVGRELDLDRAQTALFEQLRRTGLEDAELFEDGITLTRRELVDELNRPDRDPDRMADIIARETDLRGRWRLAQARRLNDFMESLDPRQRRELSSRMHRAATDRERRQARLRRFDTNGDGKLDDAECRAAHDLMRARWAERAQHWRGRSPGRSDIEHRGQRRGTMDRRMRLELLKRFDADGDDTLDAEESDALVNWVNERPSHDGF